MHIVKQNEKTSQTENAGVSLSKWLYYVYVIVRWLLVTTIMYIYYFH